MLDTQVRLVYKTSTFYAGEIAVWEERLTLLGGLRIVRHGNLFRYVIPGEETNEYNTQDDGGRELHERFTGDDWRRLQRKRSVR